MPVRIAMIGSGFVAGFYMQGLANVHGQDVVVNYSRSAKRARAFARQWGIPESTTDLPGLVARADVDLYVIALPNEEHLPTSLMLSKARKHQVCTKPLGRNAAEAKQMLAAARRSGALHGYAETEVFAPASSRRARRSARAGSAACCGCARASRTAGRTARTSGTSRRPAAVR